MEELMIVSNTFDVEEVFTKKNSLNEILIKIRNKAVLEIESTDVQIERDRKKIASVAYKIARSKTWIDNSGKQLNAELKKRTRLIDSSRKVARDFLDNLKIEIRLPLTKWEEEEKLKIKKLRQEAELNKAWEEAIEDNILFDREAEIRRKEEKLRQEELRRKQEEEEKLMKQEEEKRIAEAIEAERREFEEREKELIRQKEEQKQRELEAIKRARVAEEREEAFRKHQEEKRKMEEEIKRRQESERLRIAEEELRKHEAEMKRKLESLNSRIEEAVKSFIDEGFTSDQSRIIVDLILKQKISHIHFE